MRTFGLRSIPAAVDGPLLTWSHTSWGSCILDLELTRSSSLEYKMYMPNGLMRLIWALCTHTQLYMPNIACLVAPSISILDLGSREPYQTSIKWKKNLNLLFVSMFKMQFLMSGNSPLMYSILYAHGDNICMYWFVYMCVERGRHCFGRRPLLALWNIRCHELGRKKGDVEV